MTNSEQGSQSDPLESVRERIKKSYQKARELFPDTDTELTATETSDTTDNTTQHVDTSNKM